MSSVERRLYEEVKAALTDYLRQGDDQIAIVLDITADGFPQSSQALLQSNVLHGWGSRAYGSCMCYTPGVRGGSPG